jgi:hypothetical protein
LTREPRADVGRVNVNVDRSELRGNDVTVPVASTFGHNQLTSPKAAAQRVGKSFALLLVTIVLGGNALFGGVAPVRAAPAPEIEYTYDVTVRRQYTWPPGTDPVGYGHSICDKVSRGAGYAQVLSDVKNDVSPNDEFAANYLVSYAVNLLCPEQLWQLRKSAAFYLPPPQ